MKCPRYVTIRPAFKKLVLGGGISIILGLIGVFNFINGMSVGVIARKRELATLEAIGMSCKQIRKMEYSMYW